MKRFKAAFKNDSSLTHRFEFLNAAQGPEEAIREWLKDIVDLYIDSFSQSANFDFIAPRVSFFKEIHKGRKRRGVCDGISREPKKFKSSAIHLATHEKSRKRDLIARANTAIHETKHAIIGQLTTAYRLGMIDEEFDLYDDVQLSDHLERELTDLQSYIFRSGYKNKLLERTAIDAGNAAGRFFNQEAQKPAMKFAREFAERAVQFTFVELPRMAAYMPLPRA